MKAKITVQELERMVLDFCYDRESCKRLDIDYCNIKQDDIKKIRRYYQNFYEVIGYEENETV